MQKQPGSKSFSKKVGKKERIAGRSGGLANQAGGPWAPKAIPGGRSQKTGQKRAADHELMFKKLEDILIDSQVTIREAMVAINQGSVGIVLVVNPDRQLIGTVTDGDIRRFILGSGNLHDSVSALYQGDRRSDPEPTIAPIGASRESLIALMKKKRIRHIPILDDNNRVVDLALLTRLIASDEPALSAVVMAGGYGTRLRPLTKDIPKPMLPVGGRPLLELIVDKLRREGIYRINITTCFKPEIISDYFGDGRNFGVEFSYINENKPLGTAGALGLMKTPTETQLAMNGDILTQLNLRSMLDFHRDNLADLTVAVRQYDFQVPYGVVDTQGIRITELVEKPSYKFFVNAGIYFLEPVCYEYIPRNRRFDMTDLIECMLKDGRNVISYPIEEYWLDIGQTADYQKAQVDIQEGVVI